MKLPDEEIRLLEQLPDKPLAQINRGIEKESLRVTPDGRLSHRPHPVALGSTLTHPCITTDYSEALLEFITPPFTSVSEVLKTLENIHRYTCHHLDEELLWAHSMPCMLGDDDDVPVGFYGTSNIGKMKSVYRVGLGYRYGRLMQTIAGLHYNFSLPDSFWALLRQSGRSSLTLQYYKTARYLGLIRNFRRHFWLLIYLFGASPAVCRSFVRNRQHQLIPVNNDDHSLHAPYATSLRMGDLGYQSKAQQELHVCYNSLESYTRTLLEALTHPYSTYTAIGTKDENGNYLQLNTNLLQIENEFYSTIRPKRTTHSAEAPLLALQERGIEYIEVRCLDLNPFSPIGITAEQVHFIDVFLLHCLFSESPECNEAEYGYMQQNQFLTVYSGRDPQLQLFAKDGPRPLRNWAKRLLEEMQPVAQLLDAQQDTNVHRQSLETFSPWIDDPNQTHSGRIMNNLKASGTSYFQYAMSQARHHQQYFLDRPLEQPELQKFKEMAARSLLEQGQLEQEEESGFDEFLSEYFTQYNQLET